MPNKIKENLLGLTDSYKFTHWKQLPPDARYLWSYFESKGGEFSHTIFSSLQYHLMAYLEGRAFTKGDIEELTEDTKKHFPSPQFNDAGWNKLYDTYGGIIPLEIRAVPEGMKIPVKNILMSAVNTDPRFPWLPNYFETLLVQSWYPITVATQAYFILQDMLNWADIMGCPRELVYWKLHDFGFRGVTCPEQAGIGGMAHLSIFKGTDTYNAVRYAKHYYGSPMAGFSIPASEHSTITSWGKERELDAYKNALNVYDDCMFACVSDSFNIYNALEKLWGTELKDEILKRKQAVVFRPDSGNPKDVVINCLNILGERFGYKINVKGFKVLPDQVRLIQGDGVNRASINEILQAMFETGWSIENIAFGMGGALLQKLDRDTQKMVFKCEDLISGKGPADTEELMVYKEPITDPGKNSKRGRMILVKDGDGSYRTIDRLSYLKHEYPDERDILQTVFLNGEIVKKYNFEEVRSNVILN